MFWNLFSPRLSIEEVAKIRKAYFEGNYDDFYFIFQKNLRIPDSYFTKRKFLSEKEKKEYDGRFASARYFRGIENGKIFLTF